MATSKAATVAEYLKELPEDRRRVVSTLRKLIRKSLPKGYQESMAWGLISYTIPLSRYPDTYNGQPLAYVALAAQKNYFALYLMNVYASANEAFLRREFKKAGKRLDMGKACLRFKSLEDLPLEAIGKVVASTPVERYLAWYEANQKRR
jgi:hypothetical protein